MNIGMLRQLWSVIEETHPHKLLRLNDTDLVEQLMLQFQVHHPLNGDETQTIQVYLKTKLPLIRDIAQV